ncbi:MAG TPA: methyltransferase domain-containing protein [Ilumatobacteraceae bacterium]|nr:methyltransferase domain-containing protein [Ilumatobacteraceae bacterium]
MEASGQYAHGHHPSVLRSHSWRTVANSAAYIAAEFQPGVSVLDVGCGPGTITIDIAQRVAPARVVGIDAAPGVIEVARANAAAAGVTNVSFDVGDCYALDAADGTFGIVHAHQTLQHLVDPVRALREMRRVAAPGGLIAARDADYGGMLWTPSSGLDEWMRIYQAVHRASAGDPNAGRSMRRWALAAGLDNVATTATVWSFATTDERAWWGGMWAARVTESAFADRAIALGLADREILQRLAQAWHDFVADDTAWFGIPNVEITARVES